MRKLTVYVHSFEFPTVGFIDKEGAMHACAQAQATAFESLHRISGMLGNRYLTEEERTLLECVDRLCQKFGLEYEVVDLGTENFLKRLRLKLSGVKCPTVCYGKRMLQSAINEERLEKFLEEVVKSTDNAEG